MATTGTGAPHRRGLNWAAETARIAIIIAIFGQLVISTVPRSAIYRASENGVFDSWAYLAVTVLAAISSLGSVVSLTALPLLGIWVMRDPPRWLRGVAWLASGLIALTILQSLVFVVPSTSDWAGDLWYRVSSSGVFASVALVFPFILSVWIGVLVLTATLAARSQSWAATTLAAVSCLGVIALTLARASDQAAPEGKALVIVLSGLSVWLIVARPDALPRGARPWLVALLAIWLLPDLTALAPRLTEAMQMSSPSARWGMVARIFGSLEIGVGLSSPLLTLMIIVALLHMALETSRASALSIVCAALIALGMILPEMAWQRGVGGDLMSMIERARSGAMPVGPALFGALAAISWPLAQVALFITSIQLIRLPLARATTS